MAREGRESAAKAVLDPAKLQMDTLDGVLDEWRHAVRMFRPWEGLCITCIDGRPGTKWSFRAEGPPAFSLNILLEGRMQTAFDGGAALDVEDGSAILMATDQDTSGWDILDGRSQAAFRMVGIHFPQSEILSLIGMPMSDLLERYVPSKGIQSHFNAFLGSVSPSKGLQRMACDLIALGGASSETTVWHNIMLRAKALEMLACFLRENLAPSEISLPVPRDRSRLLEARTLLERTCGKSWSVESLARAVGLNEKRLQSGFQVLFGASVHSYLTKVRMDTAIALLQRGDSVTEAAISVGFSSLSHFSRVFRETVGVSPKHYAQGAILKSVTQQLT